MQVFVIRLQTAVGRNGAIKDFNHSEDFYNWRLMNRKPPLELFANGKAFKLFKFCYNSVDYTQWLTDKAEAIFSSVKRKYSSAFNKRIYVYEGSYYFLVEYTGDKSITELLPHGLERNGSSVLMPKSPQLLQRIREMLELEKDQRPGKAYSRLCTQGEQLAVDQEKNCSRITRAATCAQLTLPAVSCGTSKAGLLKGQRKSLRLCSGTSLPRSIAY